MMSKKNKFYVKKINQEENKITVGEEKNYHNPFIRFLISNGKLIFTISLLLSVAVFIIALTLSLKNMGESSIVMYEENGVGLAAPQVGVLKRVVVIDTTGEGPIVMINPEILETSGTQTGHEGCLSVPGKCGIVTRPDYVKAKARNEAFEEFEIEGEGLLARAICHELDHLNGKLYVDLVEGDLLETSALEEDEDEAYEFRME